MDIFTFLILAILAGLIAVATEMPIIKQRKILRQTLEKVESSADRLTKYCQDINAK